MKSELKFQDDSRNCDNNRVVRYEMFHVEQSKIPDLIGVVENLSEKYQ